MRCLALGEELRSRDLRVELIGDAEGLEFALNQIDRRGFRISSAEPDLASQFARLGLSQAVIDGYHIPASAGAELRAADIRVATLVDGTFGLHQEADLYIDQNLGAQPVPVAKNREFLAGVRYAIVGDHVLARRPDQLRKPNFPPRILVMFGGTDAAGGTSVLVHCLAETGLGMHICAVAPRETVRAEIEEITFTDGQSIEILPSLADMPATADTCDLVVSAAGTSIWELLCLRLPIAAVAVVENQLDAYQRMAAQGVVAPVGLLDDIRDAGDPRNRSINLLSQLISQPEERERLADKGGQLVDGLGRQRIIDAFLN